MVQGQLAGQEVLRVALEALAQAAVEVLQAQDQVAAAEQVLETALPAHVQRSTFRRR